ncbi:MAG: DUF58 domain-containing protein [Phycisphaerae bacterium]
MMAPGRIGLAALVFGALLALGAAIYPPLVWGVALLDIAVVLLIIMEGVSLRRSGIQATVHTPHRGEIGQLLSILVTVSNPTRRVVIVTIENQWPGSFDCPQTEQTIRVKPGGQACCEFSGRALRRGLLLFSPPIISASYGVAWGVYRFEPPTPEPVRIYPDMTPVRHYESLRRHRALGLSGVHHRRLLGSGREFEQLRDYLPDDEFRDINWRASAHHQRLISNLYQIERRQDVLICIDSSRLMARPAGDRTMMDFAISAGILLAHVADVERDHAGLLVFRDVIGGYVRPAGGASAKAKLTDKLVEIQSHPVFPSYFGLVSAIRLRQSRRGMVFIFTDLSDPQLVENLRAAAPSIARRHLVTVFSLRDPLLSAVADSGAVSPTGVAQVLAARHLSLERAGSLAELARTGVLVIEADADALNLTVINHYLSIRTRQLV